MIFRFISRRAGIIPAIVLTLSLAAAAFVAPASAQQDSVRGEYGWWQLRCSTPAGATNEQCVLIQNVVADDRPELGLSVVAFKTADRTAQILRIQVPLGVLLPNGLGLHIDGNDMGRAYFVRCFADGCYAEVILEDQLLESLKAGSEATFTVFDTPEEGIGIPVDLAGFSEGFEALP
ncbi:MAG: invasion associated locus B family protein [Roseitalea porphyridii]|uniref:invasion associated locus B family protein n=1 Tax=Roseitalea porphyridii TaxID=1852022 RepID=UPI0032EB374A